MSLVERKSWDEPGFSPVKPRTVWVYMEKLRFEGALSHWDSQGIAMAGTELRASHFVVEIPGDISLAEPCWHMSQSDIPEHCKHFLWMPSDWSCKDFWKPIARGALLRPRHKYHWRIGTCIPTTSVWSKGGRGYSQQHKLKGKAVSCTKISRVGRLSLSKQQAGFPLSSELRGCMLQNMLLKHSCWQVYFPVVNRKNQLGYTWSGFQRQNKAADDI